MVLINLFQLFNSLTNSASNFTDFHKTTTTKMFFFSFALPFLYASDSIPIVQNTFKDSS